MYVTCSSSPNVLILFETTWRQWHVFWIAKVYHIISDVSSLIQCLWYDDLRMPRTYGRMQALLVRLFWIWKSKWWASKLFWTTTSYRIVSQFTTIRHITAANIADTQRAMDTTLHAVWLLWSFEDVGDRRRGSGKASWRCWCSCGRGRCYRSELTALFKNQKSLLKCSRFFFRSTATRQA